MKILSFSLKLLLLLIVPFLAMTSCDDDDDQPNTAKVHGTISFENADVWNAWKDLGEVQVSLFPKFVQALPPAGQGWGDIPDDFFGPGVPGGRFALGAPSAIDVLEFVPGQTEYTYELEVTPGEYSALAVGFRHDTITDPNRRTATLGVHFDNPNSVSHGIVLKMDIGGQVITLFNEPAPSVITLEKGDNREINFKADFAFVNAWFQ